MRKTATCLMVFLLILSGSQAYAQKERTSRDSIMNAALDGYPPVKTILKTSIFAPFYWQLPLTGEYRLLNEIMLGRRQSILLGGSYLTRSLIFAISQAANKNSDRVNANGFRIQGAYRYYLWNRKYRPEGFFVSLHTSFASVNFNFKNYPKDYQNLQHFNINVLLGAQFLIADRVSLEFFFGPGYKNNTYTTHARTGYQVFDLENLGDNYYRHFKMSAGMNIGLVL